MYACCEVFPMFLSMIMHLPPQNSEFTGMIFIIVSPLIDLKVLSKEICDKFHDTLE